MPRDPKKEEVFAEYRVREAVAVFHSYDDLEEAIEDLELAGFDRSQINLLARKEVVEDKLGHAVKDVHELEDDPEAPTGAPVDRHEVAEGKAALTAGLALLGGLVTAGVVVAAGATVPAAFLAAAAAGGAGGGIGAMLAQYIGRLRAKDIEEKLESGGLLLWVQLRDEEQERKALEILRKHAGEDVHVHEVVRKWTEEDVPFSRTQPDPFLFR